MRYLLLLLSIFTLELEAFHSLSSFHHLGNLAERLLINLRWSLRPIKQFFFFFLRYLRSISDLTLTLTVELCICISHAANSKLMNLGLWLWQPRSDKARLFQSSPNFLIRSSVTQPYVPVTACADRFLTHSIGNVAAPSLSDHD